MTERITKTEWREAAKKPRKSRAVLVREADIQKTVCAWLELNKICFSETDAERSFNSTGSIRRKRRVREGWPDLSLVIAGRAIFLELKSAKGITSEKQMLCHRYIGNSGGVVFVANSLEVAQRQVVAIMSILEPGKILRGLITEKKKAK